MRLDIFNYEGNDITFKNNDGTIMVNATQMAKPFRKNTKDYMKRKSTEEFINALCKRRNVPLEELVTVVHGGNSRGTWLHQEVALDFAQWLSIDFKLWCNDKLQELVETGRASIQPMSQEEIILYSAQMLVAQKKELKEHDQRLKVLESQKITRPETFTIAGYANFLDMEMPLKLASRLGRKASKLCKERGIEPDTLPDPRFGRVNSYPIGILKEIFDLPLTA